MKRVLLIFFWRLSFLKLASAGLRVSLRSDAMVQCYASNEETLDTLCSVHRPFESPPGQR